MKKGERRPNRFEIRGPVTAIYIRRFWEPDVESLIDTEDLERVRGVTWTLAGPASVGRAYVYSSEWRVKMHRHLTNPETRDHVDHINGNPLDNRKANLRVTSASVNGHNRVNAPPKNVYWHQKHWRVRFMVNRERRDFGRFKDIEQAKAVAANVRDRLVRGETV
jgi:hypothetical protein